MQINHSRKNTYLTRKNKNPMEWLRKISFPLMPLYWIATSVRNFLYDQKVLKSRSFPFPVLVVGNLSTGGTGKTPHVHYLIGYLKQGYSTAVLSRGYGRKTKGFYLVSKNRAPDEVGDEPKLLQIKNKDVHVAVCESRVKGIQELRAITDAEVFVLDDAFQHRSLQPGLSILLTPYQQIYTKDCLLPYGNLRESVRAARRANVIIVTKCPDLLKEEQLAIGKELKLSKNQTVYFSKIVYADYLYGHRHKIPFSVLRNESFLLLTGIANPQFLIDYLKSCDLEFDANIFADHHMFSDRELLAIEKKANGRKIITTEKDYVRIGSGRLSNLFSLPISISFLDKEEEFISQIEAFVSIDYVL